MGKGAVFNRRALFAATCVVSGLALALSSPRAAGATNHLVFMKQVMAGVNGNSRIQFVQMTMQAIDQNLWAAQSFDGTTESRVMLVFFDGRGSETGKFKFPSNPPAGGSFQVLIATQEFTNLPGAPVPNFVIPPMLHAVSGKVCFKNNPSNIFAFFRNECLSYGSFTGDTEGQGLPAPALPIVNTVSLRRTVNFGLNSDFTLVASPDPTNNAGATVTIPVAAQTVQGETLFFNERFEGNGRTCGSCHTSSTNFRLTPSNIQARFSTVASTFDPLFISETAGTGFDFNLNTLVLTAPSAPGDLQGVITGTTGRAKVLARIGPMTYRVYGGISPALSGTIRDGTNSGTFSSITPGNLDSLESPARMRTSASPEFPQGRGLILENIDGFTHPAVFRKSPHLLNLSRTAPFGLSGDIPDLQAFATGAVVQHFPRSLGRVAGVDFRLPTSDELAAMEAFLVVQEFPPGAGTSKFNLDLFATTEAQQQGRSLFFGAAKCSRCHGDLVLAETDGSVMGKLAGTNASFNTGVANLPINGANIDDLPTEPDSSVGAPNSREFSTPSLFNVRNNAPFFHDSSVPTLFDAVDFYNSPQFNGSPAGVDLGGISLTAGQINDVVAFLESLVVRPYTLVGGPLDFGKQLTMAGETAPRTITITNTSASPITFDLPGCRLTGADPGEFVLVRCPLDTPLAPGESRGLQVSFDPSTVGPKSAIFEVLAADPSGVDLSGVGVAGSISGTVRRRGSPVAGAMVRLTGPGGQRTTRTDAAGFYVFSSLGAGRYVLDAARDFRGVNRLITRTAVQLGAEEDRVQNLDFR